MASPTKVATKRATAVRPATFTKAVANPTPMMFPATIWKPCANVPYRLLWTVISATMGANTGESSPGRALAICQATATATEALMRVNQVSRLLGAFRRWLTGDRSVRLTPPTETGIGARLPGGPPRSSLLWHLAAAIMCHATGHRADPANP